MTIRKTTSNQVFLFLSGAIFIEFGALDVILSGFDPTSSVQDISAAPRYLRYGIALILLAVVLIRRGTRAKAEFALKRILPFLLAVCLIDMYAQDVSSSIAQLFALTTMILFCLSLLAMADTEFAFKVYTTGATMLTVGSCLFALFVPSRGTIVSSSAYVGDLGSWVGLLGSKNELGPSGAIVLALSIVNGGLFFSKYIRVLALASAAACVIFAKSGTGISMVFITVALGLLLKATRNAVTRYITLISFIIVLILINFDDIGIDYILSLLGKERTFTGRSDIWNVGLSYAEQFQPLGAGTGFSYSKITVEYAFKSLNVPHFHSAYIGFLIDYGWMSIFLLSSLFIYIMYLMSALKQREDNALRDGFIAVSLATFQSGFTEPYLSLSSGFIAFSFYFSILGLLTIHTEKRPIAPKRAHRS